jgi:hypothetical protein
MHRVPLTALSLAVAASACARSAVPPSQSSPVAPSGIADVAGRWSARFSDGSRLSLELEQQGTSVTGVLRGAPSATDPEITLAISGELLADTLIVRDARGLGVILEGLVRGSQLNAKVRDSRRYQAVPLGERLKWADSSPLRLIRDR